ncbi:MAG TPA: tripartite tricarboxylate transporter substrate binding protein [Rhizobium sp.]
MSYQYFKILATLTVAGLVTVPVPGQAEGAYPCKQITWIVPFSAGGGVDRTARVIADKLAPTLGLPIAVETRPGASGAIGAQLVADSTPDGCTLLSTSSSLSVSQVIRGPENYNLLTLTPVINIGELSYALAVNTQNGVKTIEDLAAKAKEAPGQIKYATSGRESVQSLLWAYLASKAGVELTAVTYKGGGEQHVDMLANRVQLMATDIAQMRSYIEAGQVAFIGVTAASRVPQLPEVPAVSEVFPGYEVATTYGIAAAPGTPAELVERLNNEINKVLKDPAVIDTLTRDALFVLKGGTSTDYAQKLRDDISLYRELARLAGVEVKG